MSGSIIITVITTYNNTLHATFNNHVLCSFRIDLMSQLTTWHHLYSHTALSLELATPTVFETKTLSKYIAFSDRLPPASKDPFNVQTTGCSRTTDELGPLTSTV